MATDGLTTIQSSFGPQDTVRRLEAAVKAKGMTIFARIDHAAGAAEVGLALRPTELVIFGNARGGTPLMQLAQTIGIDLPLKALVWQDAGKTWLSYDVVALGPTGGSRDVGWNMRSCAALGWESTLNTSELSRLQETESSDGQRWGSRCVNGLAQLPLPSAFCS